MSHIYYLSKLFDLEKKTKTLDYLKNCLEKIGNYDGIVVTGLVGFWGPFSLMKSTSGL